MALTGNEIRGVARGILAPGSTADGTRADHVFTRRYIETDFTDGGTAGTAALEKVIHTAQVSGMVVSAWIALQVTAAQDPANTAQFTLAKRPTGGAATTIATWDTTTGQNGSITQWTNTQMALTAAQQTYNSTDQLTFKLAKSGAGVAIASATGAAHLTVLIQEDT